MRNCRSLSLLSLALITITCAFAEGQMRDAGAPFGRLPLVDEVLCATDTNHLRVESPKGSSVIETILGRECRALPNTGGPRFFAYRVGRGKDLKPGAAYLLTVEFPEDKPRTMFILNRGCETGRGVATGAALGDVLYTYTDNNAESLRIPLSGKMRAWKMLFFLHDRFPDLSQPRGAGPRPMLPKDGFWVVIAQSSKKNAPVSNGAAVFRIRLFRVPDDSRLRARVNFPPEGLPRRHLFWREEMADGVIDSGDATQRQVTDETRWFEYKARLMRFLGMNTFCKDLLEFGHNQGWDAAPGGGNDWYWANRNPKRWEQILKMLRGYGVDVLPYYEWCASVGAKGLGAERRCRPLGSKKEYTHISWTEKFNADITDPDTLTDAKKLIDATVARFKDQTRFLGVWFRTRPSQIPISFSDACLIRFAVEANGKMIATREDLRKNPSMLKKYYTWWFGKRKAFLVALRDYLRSKAGPSARVFFTAYPTEPCPALRGFQKCVVTDDLPMWRKILAAPAHAKTIAVDYSAVVAKAEYPTALLSPAPTWGGWEWQHAAPRPDPQHYVDTPGVLMTYPFNRAYSVSSRKCFDAFRTVSGLAVVRHYPLNENSMSKELGYFACDVERSGPYCMLGEVRAVAYGDPWFIGYLAGGSFNRGFPEYARAFDEAFLALPALPSRELAGAASVSSIVVRAIETKKHGAYLAIANVGLTSQSDVEIRLPREGKIFNAATGAVLAEKAQTIRLSFHPCELKALRVE